MKKHCNHLAFFLVICVTFFGNTFSYAETTGISPNIKLVAESLITSAIADSNATLEVGAYSLTGPIPTYALENQGIQYYNDAAYYLVFCDNTPVSVFTVNGANSNSPTYTLGEDFIESLYENVLLSNNEYNFVVTENQIFALTNSNAVEIAQYDISIVSDDLSKSAERYIADTYSAGEVLTIANSVKDMRTSNKMSTIALSLPETKAIVEVTGTVPSYTQPSKSNWCWAATAWCVGETLNPKANSVQDCVDYCKKVMGDGGDGKDQVKILSELYDLSPAQHKVLTEDEMKTLLGTNDEPFIMSCYVPGTAGQKLGHSVTCYAYNDAYSPIRLAVMDSLVGSGASNWRWMTTSGTTYKITSAGTTYTYEYSVTPNGI